MTAPRTFEHHALIYESAGELPAAAVTFLAEGLAAGEGAVLVGHPSLAGRIAAGIGQDAPVHVADPEAIFTGAARALAALRRLALDCGAAGAGARIVAGVPLGGSPDACREWGRYEAAANAAFAALRLSVMCAYDGRNLPHPTRAIIGRTHPRIRTHGAVAASAGFVDPATFLRVATPASADPVEQAEPNLTVPAVKNVYDLGSARSAIRRALARTPVRPLTVGDFTAAAGELLANAVQHGSPPVRVRLWIRADRIVCTVHDHGSGFDDPLVGYLPPGDHEGDGAGLWLARQTCDLIETGTDPDGFSVRATTFLGPHRDRASVAGARARAELAHRRTQAARARVRNLADRLRERQETSARREQRVEVATDQVAGIQRRLRGARRRASTTSRPGAASPLLAVSLFHQQDGSVTLALTP